MSERRWSLDAARELLPEVRKRTERAVRETESLESRRDALAEDTPEWEELDGRMRDAIGRWGREMEALGVEVKGLWLVDFDCGAGYYCWKWPEDGLDWFHGYEEGFAGRTPIQ